MNIKDYYQTQAGAGREEGEPRLNLVASLIPDSACHVLDLGCYDGFVSKRFKKNGRRVVGADIHEGPLKEARKVIDAAHIIDLDEKWNVFSDGEFDCAVMSAVLEHVFDYKNVFSELARVIRVNGCFIHATPNVASLRGRAELFFGKIPNWYRNFEHIRLWTRAYLCEQLEPYGFKEQYFTGCYVRAGRIFELHSKIFPAFAPIIIQKFRRL